MPVKNPIICVSPLVFACVCGDPFVVVRGGSVLREGGKGGWDGGGCVEWR